MRILELAAHNLSRRRTRSVLTCSGIAIAVAGFVALVGLAGSLKSSWYDAMSELGTHLIVFERKTFNILSGSLPEAHASALAKIPGVNSVAAQLVKYAPVADEYHALVIGWLPDAAIWRKLKFLAGRPPRADNKREVVLGEALARNLNASVGQLVEIMFAKFRVVGIVQSGGIMNNHAAYVSLPVLQELLHRPKTVTIFVITVVDPGNEKKLRATKKRILSVSNRFDVAESEELVKENSVIEMFESIAWATSGIALVIGMLAVTNTMLMSVAERQTEIGTLRAIGWSKASILKLILLEGALISILGALFGCVLGRLAIGLMTEIPALKGLIEAQISLWNVAIIFFAMAALGTLGGLFPAWQASIADPERALRSV